MSEPEAMKWTTEGCPVQATLDILGDRASFLIIREIGLGVRRFSDVQARTRIPRDVLTRRLTGLVADGVLVKAPYREPGSRTREEYRLTEMGFALTPVLVSMAAWGSQWGAQPGGPSIEFVHANCGAIVETPLTCTASHVVGSPRDVITRPGPGAQRRHG